MPKKLTTCPCVRVCRENLMKQLAHPIIRLYMWIFYSSVICGTGPRARADSATALHHGLRVGVLHVAAHIS